MDSSHRRDWRFRVYTSAEPSKARAIESRRLTYGATRLQAQRLADQGHRVHVVDPEGRESGRVPKGYGLYEPLPQLADTPQLSLLKGDV